jgi:hypothetical protein
MLDRIPADVQKGAILGAVVLVGLYLVARTVKGQIATTLNPASDKNAAYSGVNAVGAALTGDKAFSLGVWIYELLHPNATKAPVATTPRVTAPATAAPNAENVIRAQSDRQARTDPTRAPSILIPDRGGIGGSFEQQSSPDWDIYSNL